MQSVQDITVSLKDEKKGVKERVQFVFYVYICNLSIFVPGLI